MDFNNQRVKTINGRRFVRIPWEYRLNTDTVFMYWNGFGVVVAPVNARFADEYREMAKLAAENGDDIPPKDAEASP